MTNLVQELNFADYILANAMIWFKFFVGAAFFLAVYLIGRIVWEH